MEIIKFPGLPMWLRWYRISLHCGDPALIPELGKSPGEGNGFPPVFMGGRITWTVEPVGLQSIGLQRVGYD